VKNAPGRKTDVSGCQWLQYLHSVGSCALRSATGAKSCAVRSLWRHRAALIRYAASHVQHLQKALTQMNIQLAHVISDVTADRPRDLDAILAGERDGQSPRGAARSPDQSQR
jgi:hypothetical protein